ncbi:Hypothetical Protein FCC1311_088692 [Hondaea fermentalgiana]|uniref:Uncharacterized protein n=1 Tax=Hondaea fermentalgiana TaxID=2315210 RepID=A0A2R5GXF8_9STRA|nr:Hypothetical Protein FCC1311_088692 [Hondaea fermentalgiana]|eukprot:GBG32644.1 Hypothetical Protein FCC1311_088692 [Hondaea fermentalgiana]
MLGKMARAWVGVMACATLATIEVDADAVAVTLPTYIQTILSVPGFGPTLQGLDALLDVLEASECVNCEEEGLYDEIEANPYAMVDINNHALQVQEGVDCYAEVLSLGDEDEPQLVYRLTTDLTGTEDINGTNSGGAYLGKFVTHLGQCGACSPLQALAVYVRTRSTMTEMTKSCAMSSLIDFLTFGLSDVEIRNGKNCIQGMGLRHKCRDIWFWNTISTAQGCAATCFSYRNSAPNESTKFKCSNLNPLCKTLNVDYCDICKNTMNGNNICHPFQYEDGPFRLNPCIQCDECKSGPLFQAVAARTRRASNIKSSITRPFNAEETANLARISWTYGYSVSL